MKQLKIRVSSGDTVGVAASGRFLRLVDATAPVMVQADGVELWLSQGKSFTLDAGFTYLRMTGGGAAETVTVEYGDGRTDEPAVTGTVRADIIGVGVLTDAPDIGISSGASATLAEANGDRRRAIIAVANESAGTLRVGAAPAAGRGLSVYPGQWVALETTAEIVGYAEGGAVTVEVIEEARA